MSAIMTQRQIQILIAVVEQYAEVASPVGSNLLAKLFNVSSATIRADMAELEKMGLITQPHTSAGRIPTDKGYRYYVNYANQPTLNRAISDHERRAERAISARVIGGGLPQQTIRNAVDTMVELTHNLGLATIGDQLYMSGLSNLLGQPEFIHTDS
ncbi:MAG TPA: DeoR family transcriptional regulator, partial [Candidatus Saccharimonadales bacterium]